MESDIIIGTAFICDSGHVIDNCFETCQASYRYCPKCSGEIHSSCRFCGVRIPGNRYRKSTTSELDGNALSDFFYGDNDDLDDEKYLRQIYKPCPPQLIDKITDDNKPLYCGHCGKEFPWTINMLKQKVEDTDLCEEDKDYLVLLLKKLPLSKNRLTNFLMNQMDCYLESNQHFGKM